MKIYEFKLPDIGEGVTEGEIVKWLVSPGEVVVEDQPLVEVMTDKATVTITAPKSGKVLETRGAEGSVVPVHAVLVVFDLDGGSAGVTPGERSLRSLADPSGPPKPPLDGAAERDPYRAREQAEPTHHAPVHEPTKGEPAATAVGDIKETLPGMNLVSPVAASAPAARSNGQDRPSAYFNEKPLAAPATRALARELGVDLRTVQPSGPNGRVTKDDVRTRGQAASAVMTPAPMAVRAPAPSPEPARTATQFPPSPATARAPLRIAPAATVVSPEEERIPLRGVRRRIFDGMARSKHTAAHFTFVEECDVSALKDLRARLRPAAEKAGVKLTFLPFFVKAVVAALKKHPMLNSAFDEGAQEIVVRRYYDIGVASATEAGLIVPVVRSADRKSILEIARDIERLGEAARAGKIAPADLGGSTFTITSLGSQGGLFATPILNFPEVGILGIHQMKQKPVVRDGQIVIGEVMLLSLSFDHRIIDGHVGAAFAYEIIGYLQEPDRLFLEMG